MPSSRAGDETKPGWRFRAPLVAVLLAPILEMACGSSMSPTPVSTPAAPSAFLQALSLDSGGTTLLTFAIQQTTGLLVLRGTQAAGTAKLLAADPGSRFLYTASYRTIDDDNRYANTFVSYAIDPASGSPVPRSDTGPTFPPGEWGGTPVSLGANPQQLYVVLERNQPYQSVPALWTTLRVDPTSGAIASPPTLLLKDYEALWVVAEPTGRFVYLGGPSLCDEGDCAGVYVHSIGPDGTLRRIAAEGVPVRNGVDGAGLLAGSFLLVTDDAGGITSFAIDATTGLLTRRARLSSAFAEWTTPRLAFAAGLVALTTETQVQLFALASSGDLTLKDTMAFGEKPALEAGFVSFDPLGRFLYVSRSGEGVYILAVTPGGLLQHAGTVAQGGGPIVVTVPPS